MVNPEILDNMVEPLDCIPFGYCLVLHGLPTNRRLTNVHDVTNYRSPNVCILHLTLTIIASYICLYYTYSLNRNQQNMWLQLQLNRKVKLTQDFNCWEHFIWDQLVTCSWPNIWHYLKWKVDATSICPQRISSKMERRIHNYVMRYQQIMEKERKPPY